MTVFKAIQQQLQSCENKGMKTRLHQKKNTGLNKSICAVQQFYYVGLSKTYCCTAPQMPRVELHCMHTIQLHDYYN